MRLFGWLIRDPEKKGMVRGRAVAIAHNPTVEVRSNVVENSFGPDSISTLSVTVKLLKTGEFAGEVGSVYKHTVVNSPVPAGCTRVHCNVPNWVHVLVRQDGQMYRRNTEVPVWVNPETGKIYKVDKDKLIEELLPDKEEASYLYNNPHAIHRPGQGETLEDVLEAISKMVGGRQERGQEQEWESEQG